MRLPNLILAGAPKCGTSSLYRWLTDHPQIAPASDKELFYVVDRDSPFRNPDANIHDHGLDGYGRFYRHADPDSPWAVDGTTHTLYQRSAIESLGRMPQAPRILVVVRRPTDRVYSSFRFSQHHLARFSQAVTFADFRRAVDAEDLQTLRRWVPHERSLYVLRRDVTYSEYIDWLIPWRRAFGESLRILVFETMRSHSRRVLRRLAEELGIDGGFYDDYPFSTDNATIRPRHRRLHRWLRRLRPWIPKVPATVALYRRYLGLQRTPMEAPSAEDQRALARLDGHFAPFNDRLAEAFHLDLSSWRRP